MLNTKENGNYKSASLPDPVWFGIDEMDKDEKIRFLKWYKKENNRVMNSGEEYDLRKEMKNIVTMIVLSCQQHLVILMNQ